MNPAVENDPIIRIINVCQKVKAQPDSSESTSDIMIVSELHGKDDVDSVEVTLQPFSTPVDQKYMDTGRPNTQVSASKINTIEKPKDPSFRFKDQHY